MNLDHNDKQKGQVVLIDANIHKKAKLSKKNFLNKVSSIKYLRTRKNPYYISFYITDIHENNNLIKFHDLVNKGIFDFDEYHHVFAISLDPKLYSWFKSHDIITIQKLITAWLAGLYFFNKEKREILKDQIYKPLLEEILSVVDNYYHAYDLPNFKELERMLLEYGDDSLIKEENRGIQFYQEVCSKYAKASPPEFLKSPFKYDMSNGWGVNQYHNFEFEWAYLTDNDWERIIKGDSKDDMHRAEGKDELWEKWKHVYTTFDQRKNFVYSFYFQKDEKESSSPNNKRESIPITIRNQVWRRDNGACVQCGSNEKLEFDHIIPVSKGGSSTYRNLQLLCEPCNRKKSNKIG